MTDNMFDFGYSDYKPKKKRKVKTRVQIEKERTAFLVAREKRIAVERKVRQRQIRDAKNNLSNARTFVAGSVQGGKKVGRAVGRGAKKSVGFTRQLTDSRFDTLKQKIKGSIY